MKRLYLTIIICALILLCACGGEPPVEELTTVVTAETISELDSYPDLVTLDLSGSDCYAEIEAYIAAHPQVDVTYTVSIGGSEVDSRVQGLDLSEQPYELDTLCAAAPYLKDLTDIRFDTPLSPDELDAVFTAFPQANVHYLVRALGGEFEPDTTELDLSVVSPKDAAEAAHLLCYLPSLTRVNLLDQNGESAWTLDDLELLRSAAPEGTAFDCRFELFGQFVSSEDEEIIYERVPIGDEGLERVRAALPYLRSCNRFLMDDCDIDYELLSQLRDDFPETKIVWRVRFGVDSALTDTEVIWSIYVRDENCFVLNYCNEVKYIDLGHTLELSDISFMAYMPLLEVVIIARTNVSDLSPLLNCPNLEYLEIFSTSVTDLSLLANFTNLEHLNISNLPEVTDISPLYGLTKLKRLDLVLSYVPAEQKAEIRELLPDCQMIFQAVNPTDNGWRRDRLNNFVPRYALLREQIGYANYASPKDLIPWNYVWDMGYTTESVFTRS